jgi:hypothetical protein
VRLGALTLLVLLLVGCSSSPSKSRLYYSKTCGPIWVYDGIDTSKLKLRTAPVITQAEKDESRLFTNSIVLQPPPSEPAKELQKKGYDPLYARACGPVAISDALAHFDITVSPEEVGKYTQSKHPLGNIVRRTMSLVHYESLSITWPWEVVPTLRHFGVEANQVDGSELVLRTLMLQMERKGEVGIALIRKRGIMNYHYKYFGKVGNVFDYYDDDTEVLHVFVLRNRLLQAAAPHPAK